MKEAIHNQLQLSEIFHLEFLRRLARKVKPQVYALKGGTNLRLFFNSFRYSEDMDLDVSGIKLEALKDVVMNILSAPSFKETLEPFGIKDVVPPDISKAKQTDTTQRFKVHLLTSGGEEIFTKVEFSRRRFKGEAVVQPVSDNIMRTYKMPPLLVAHYNINSAIAQKIEALAARSITQARDVFDLYILNSQYENKKEKCWQLPFLKARENAFEINFEQFRDTVVSYLSPDDRPAYNTAESWEEIKLKVSNFIEELEKKYG